MADRQNELKAERETSALKKLQAAAGLVERKEVERLDWMYEQSSAVKPDDETLMNKPVEGQKDKDMQDMKNLNGVSGSLFLKNATKTTEDMLRKLREDPLFQIRRQEQAARSNMMANPLIMAKMKKKEQKEAKKALKKAKKAAKKEKKAMKKAAGGKSKKKKSSSSSDDSSPSEPPSKPPSQTSCKQQEEPEPKRPREKDLSSLGPSTTMLSQREERAQRTAQQKEAALASRGLGTRLTEEEKNQRVEQMRLDAKKHDKIKDQRMKSADEREKQIEELEAKMRANSDQQYFRDIRKEAYAGNNEDSVADRLKSQRHRRQKHINDPLEKD